MKFTSSVTVLAKISDSNTINDYKYIINFVNGVILRFGYRNPRNNELVYDKKFLEYFENFKDKTNIGIYFESAASNIGEAIQEAEFVMNMMKDKDLELPIFVQSKYMYPDRSAESDMLNKTARTEVIDAFCKYIEDNGKTAGIYATDTWFSTQLDIDKLPYKKWVNEYDGKPVIVKDYIACSNKIVDIKGIEGEVEISFWNGGELKIVKDNSNDTIESDEFNIYETGAKFKAFNIPLYSSLATSKVSTYIQGTYYLWSSKIEYERVRVTNNIKNVATPGIPYGYVKYRDIEDLFRYNDFIPDTKKPYEKDSIVTLSHTKVYTFAISKLPREIKSGEFKIYSTTRRNNRVRVYTTKTDLDYWVNWDDVKDQFE